MTTNQSDKPVRRTRGRVPPPRPEDTPPGAHEPSPNQPDAEGLDAEALQTFRGMLAGIVPIAQPADPQAGRAAPAPRSGTRPPEALPNSRRKQRKGRVPGEAFDDASSQLRAQRRADATAHADADPHDEQRAIDARKSRYPSLQRTETAAFCHPPHQLIQAIKQPLEQIGRHLGVRPYQFFADWLYLVEVTLKDLPWHLANARKTGGWQPHPDGKPQVEIDAWNQVFARYGSKDNQQFVYKQFREAFHALLNAHAAGSFDYIGHVYQDMELSDKHYQAQYWTPMSVAFMMAQILNPAADVYERIFQALTHPDNLAGQALLVAASLFTLQPREGREGEDGPIVEALASGAGDYFFNRLIPAALPYYEPVRLNEPCVGSGVMIVAAAASVPPWMNELGLIQYSGMDTDHLCVRMAQINCMLLGLNGYALTCWEAAQDPDALAAMQDPERHAEWQAIRERLHAERERQRQEREELEAKLRVERATLQAGDLSVDVEEVGGKQKKSLKSKDGLTQLELF